MMRKAKLESSVVDGIVKKRKKLKRLNNREYLIAQFKRRGVSRRRALWGMNLVFAEIKDALARGEEVDLGWGKLKVVRHKHRTQTGRFLNREMTTYKQPFTVVLETNREFDRLLTPIVLPARPGSPPGTKPFGQYYLRPEWMSPFRPRPWPRRSAWSQPGKESPVID
jgi:nucleoid DNA-binding protein